MKQEKKLEIKNKLGLHARPAAQLVQMIKQHKSEVFIEKNGEVVDGRSILSVLALAGEPGSALKFIISGQDSTELMNKIEAFFQNRFNEE
ncbi:MAG: HPr family phosphocarrier protein [bacterium]|nr:HPr family phosphocarrier protein [bacterium]